MRHAPSLSLHVTDPAAGTDDRIEDRAIAGRDVPAVQAVNDCAELNGDGLVRLSSDLERGKCAARQLNGPQELDAARRAFAVAIVAEDVRQREQGRNGVAGRLRGTTRTIPDARRVTAGDAAVAGGVLRACSHAAAPRSAHRRTRQRSIGT